jgi:hypothetical protein
MDSCSYRPICRRNSSFCWRIRSSIPVACAVRIHDGFFATAIIAANVLCILQAVDGIALKRAVDSWAAAPPEEKTAAFRVAEGIRWTEIGTNSIFRILEGTVAIIFGVAIMLSPIVVGRWIGAIGIFAGAATIAAGVEVAYVGFGSSMVGLGANSMIIYSIWIVILGAFMWRKTMSKKVL